MQNGGVFYRPRVKAWGKSWGRVVRRFKGSLRGSLGVQGDIIMPYLTLDLWIAGGELLVNLCGLH